MLATINIEISQRAAEAIEKLNERYYFGLFEQIALSEYEEMRFRDAIAELSKQIKEVRE